MALERNACGPLWPDSLLSQRVVTNIFVPYFFLSPALARPSAINRHRPNALASIAATAKLRPLLFGDAMHRASPFAMHAACTTSCIM